MDVLSRTIATVTILTATVEGENRTWSGSIPEHEKEAAAALAKITKRLRSVDIGKGLTLDTDHNFSVTSNRLELRLIVKAAPGTSESELQSMAEAIEKHIEEAGRALSIIRASDKLIAEKIKIESSDVSRVTKELILMPKTAAIVAEALRGVKNKISIQLGSTGKALMVGGGGVARNILSSDENDLITSKIYSVCDRSKKAQVSLRKSSYKELSFPESMRNELLKAQLEHRELTLTISKTSKTKQGKTICSGGQIIQIDGPLQRKLIE